MNKKMVSRLQELGFDPNRPISKHELLQVEGNRNPHPTPQVSQNVETEVEPEWALFVSPPFEIKKEKWNEYVEHLNNPEETQENTSGEEVKELEVKPKKETVSKKTKNALKKIVIPSKENVPKKKKSKKEES